MPKDDPLGQQPPRKAMLWIDRQGAEEAIDAAWQRLDPSLRSVLIQADPQGSSGNVPQMWRAMCAASLAMHAYLTEGRIG
jgi:hypothetical protein